MYITLEIQSNADGSVGTLIDSFESRDQAESKYHLVLSAAAVSDVPVHSCVLITDEGFLLESKSYKHGEEPEPEEE